jgi:hypothetical protein
VGPAYFVITIMGCSDGGLACRTVATPSAHYGSEQACLAARGETLLANSDLDFPTLLAECLQVRGKTPASAPQPDLEGSLAA